MLRPCGLASQLAEASLHFHSAFGFATQILAYTLDSLVRVSRRADRDYFVTRLNHLDGIKGRIQGSRNRSHTYHRHPLLPPSQFQVTQHESPSRTPTLQEQHHTGELHIHARLQSTSAEH